MKTCEHINYNNERDCENEAEQMCMCCGVPICDEHLSRDCEYGGMGFIDID